LNKKKFAGEASSGKKKEKREIYKRRVIRLGQSRHRKNQAGEGEKRSRLSKKRVKKKLPAPDAPRGGKKKDSCLRRKNSLSAGFLQGNIGRRSREDKKKNGTRSEGPQRTAPYSGEKRKRNVFRRETGKETQPDGRRAVLGGGELSSKGKKNRRARLRKKTCLARKEALFGGVFGRKRRASKILIAHQNPPNCCEKGPLALPMDEKPAGGHGEREPGV